jgi:putative acetyltransferase
VIEIKIADTPAAIQVARSLLREYWASFGFDSSFQNFEEELLTLPGAYASPSGRLLIAYIDNVPAGCGAGSWTLCDARQSACMSDLNFAAKVSAAL